MRVILDEGLDSLVKLGRYLHVLDTILHHPGLGFLVAFQDRPPKSKAFMLHLITNRQERGNVGQLVHHKPKALDRFQEVD